MHDCRGAEVTEDGAYLLVHVDRGCDPTNMLYYADLRELSDNIHG